MIDTGIVGAAVSESESAQRRECQVRNKAPAEIRVDLKEREGEGEGEGVSGVMVEEESNYRSILVLGRVGEREVKKWEVS